MPDLRRLRRRGRRARIPRPLAPSGIQLRYYAALKEMLGYARSLVAARLLPRLPDLLERATVAHGDTRLDAHPGGRVNSVMVQIAEAFARRYTPMRLAELATKIAGAVSEHQRGQLFRLVKAAVGVDLQTMATPKLGAAIQRFTAENVALVKSVPANYFADVEKTVLAGMRAGDRHEEIANELEERLGVAESSAKLIARDQVLKFNGELNEVRQQALGIDKYIWRTVEDERVRSEHAERDGEIYNWDDPPGDPEDPRIGGHPGQAINCRCYAEPMVDDVLEAIDGEG